MKEFYRVKLKTYQCNEFKTFQGKRVNSSLRFILKIFLKFLEFKSQNILLYNNQINARALIGQSAVGYCAGKPTEKSRVF